MPTGSGIAVGAGISGLVNSFLAEKISQDQAFEAARRAAPFAGFDTLNGTYVKDGSHRGLNLQANPGATTAVGHSSTLYGDRLDTVTTGTYSISRYNVEKFGVADVIAREWSQAYAVDMAAKTSTRIFEAASGVHSKLVWDAIGTSGNYASGFSADPGDFTSASADWIGLINTMRTALIGAQKWFPGQTLGVFMADDLMVYAQKADQVRSSTGKPNANFATPDELGAFFSAYCYGAELIPVMSTHLNSSGTVTRDFSGKIAFVPLRGGQNQAFFTATLGGATPSPIQVESERDAALQGDVYYGALYAGVTVADNQGAYLAYNMLS